MPFVEDDFRRIGEVLQVHAFHFRGECLVFHLGTSTTFADPPGMTDQLNKLDGRWLALVEERQRAAFEKAAEESGMGLKVHERWNAFNYSQGRRITLTLYGYEGPVEREIKPGPPPPPRGPR